MNPKNPYHSKHGARLAAEFVTVALAVWDRQHGEPSVSWDQLPDLEKQKREAHALQIREKGFPAPVTEREAFEQMMWSACYEEETKEADVIQQIKDSPQSGQTGPQRVVPVKAPSPSPDPNDAPPPADKSKVIK